MTEPLQIENVSPETLAGCYGTPLYAYSEEALTNAFDAYKTAFAPLDPLICYAVKANGNLSVLQHFAALGSGFDIVSGGELERVLAAGGDAGKTLFSGVGKSAEEIAFALDCGIGCFNAESLPELERINRIAGKNGKKAPVSLRINPDVDAGTHPYISTGLKSNKFGIAYADAADAFIYAASLEHLRVTGIDCHIGSQITDLSPMVEALERLLALIDSPRMQAIRFEHIDLGGGVGIVYDDEEQPDLAAYAKAVCAKLAGRDMRLMLEPGRSLVGNAGTLLTRVEYVKYGEEKNFVIVDAAMNDLIRPTLYGAYHRISNVSGNADAPIKADIVGPICETGDFLGTGRLIAAKEGDLIAIAGAGAYAASMASNYNTRPRAAEVMVKGSGHRLIRTCETVAQLLENELPYLDPAATTPEAAR